MAKDRVPGTYKSTASFEDKTLKNPMVKNIALNDTRVLDEDYDYTKNMWPGNMNEDTNLSSAESMHIKR